VSRTKRGQVLGQRGGFRGCTVWLTGGATVDRPEFITPYSLVRGSLSFKSKNFYRMVVISYEWYYLGKA